VPVRYLDGMEGLTLLILSVAFFSPIPQRAPSGMHYVVLEGDHEKSYVLDVIFYLMFNQIRKTLTASLLIGLFHQIRLSFGMEKLGLMSQRPFGINDILRFRICLVAQTTHGGINLIRIDTKTTREDSKHGAFLISLSEGDASTCLQSVAVASAPDFHGV
jgi:hypothetical protein